MSDWLRMHALADNQLTETEQQEAHAQLKGCEKSRAEYETVLMLKRTMSKCEKVECEDTWARCQVRLREIDRTRKVERTVGRYAWAMTAFFLVAIMSAAIVNRMHGPRLTAGEATRLSSTFAPLTTPTLQNVDERSKWLEGLFDGQARVRTDQLQVLAVRQGVANGMPLLRLDLHDSKGDLFLFVTASGMTFHEQRETQYYTDVQVQEMDGIAWKVGRKSLLLLGKDRGPDELRSLATRIVTP